MADLLEKDKCTSSVVQNELIDSTISKAVVALKEEVSLENGIDYELQDDRVRKNFPDITEDDQEHGITKRISLNGPNGNPDDTNDSTEAPGKNNGIAENMGVQEKDETHVQADKNVACRDSLNGLVSPNSHLVNISNDITEGMEAECYKDDGDVSAVEPRSFSDHISDLVGYNSVNPSITSEDSSRDSSSCHSNKSDKITKPEDRRDPLVGTVKDDDGEDILITLNADKDAEKEDIDEKINEEVHLKVTDKEENKINAEKKIGRDNQAVDKQMSKAECSKYIHSQVMENKQTVAGVPTSDINKGTVNKKISSPLLVQSGKTITGLPSGVQLLRQGNQYGYITNVGSQNLFVPVSIPMTVANALTTNHNKITSNALADQLKTVYQPVIKPVQPQPQISNLTAENVHPKSSLDMITLMKWEVENRIPDNYNWSIVFHARKEDLSSVTTFLQDLGSDVVKEQVYKDIIQIQTKKKESGDLKDEEIDSLDKMKTVFENTKKKVEHLQLDTVTCDGTECDFKTECPLIIDYHKDFPHYIPPWDTNKGWMACSHCDFKTKVIAQFVFHMDTVHKIQAKFLEKEQYFQCHLCPFNAATKNKLERHQPKCMKHFKLNVNLQPYYHDINFCMKSCYYKPRKPIIKPPPKPLPPPPPPKLQPRPTMQTRQTDGVVIQPQIPANTRAPMMRPQVPTNYGQTAVRQPVSKLAQQNISFFNPVNHIRPDLPRPGLIAIQSRAPVSAQAQKAIRPPGREMSGFEVCELCGGYVKDRQALRIHFYYAHKVDMPLAIFNRPTPPLTCEVCKSHYWTTQGLTKHKTTQRHFTSAHSTTSGIGSNQQCFICGRKVNSLFVHIEQVHGMTMKDLVLMKKCIMCGITAVDYRSLEVHMASAHGVLIKANDYVEKLQGVQQVKTPVNHATSDNIKDGKIIGKINFCVFCQMQFPDNIQLTVHCIKIHATCDTCGMVVASSKFLDTHNCKQVCRSCYICDCNNMTPEKYAEHLREHVKPCKVKILKMSELEIFEIKDKIKREYKPAVISLDSEDSDVEVVETKPNKVEEVLEKPDDEKTEPSCKTIDMDVTAGEDNENSKGSAGKPVVENEKQGDHQNDKNEKCSISDIIQMVENVDNINDIKTESAAIKTESIEDGNNMLEVESLSNKSIIEKNQDEIKVEHTGIKSMVINELNDSENENKNRAEIDTVVDKKQLQNSDSEYRPCVETRKRKNADEVVQGGNIDFKKWSRLEYMEDKNCSELVKSELSDSLNNAYEVTLKEDENLKQDIGEEGT